MQSMAEATQSDMLDLKVATTQQLESWSRENAYERLHHVETVEGRMKCLVSRAEKSFAENYSRLRDRLQLHDQLLRELAHRT